MPFVKSASLTFETPVALAERLPFLPLVPM